MSTGIDLPSSTNGALLVLSVVGFGLSVHYNESLLSSFFSGVIVITGIVWVFFLSLTVYRNLLALDEVGGPYDDVLGEFLMVFLGILFAAVVILFIFTQ